IHFFCSAGCRQKFIAHPARYLRSTPTPAPQTYGPAGYACPMHPQVHEAAPGLCSICGMSLEPQIPLGGGDADPERKDMARRFWIGLALTAPLILIDMPSHILGSHSTFGSGAVRLAELLLCAPVVLWAGAPFFARAWRSILVGRFNMFTLIALGAGAAFAASLAVTIAPNLVPPAFLDSHGSAPVYFEASAAIITFALLGQVLELGARARTGEAIRALVNRAPKTAHRLDAAGGETETPIEALGVGDRLRIRPGEKVPVDGVILEGQGALDESMMTGESTPVDKGPGDRVVGGVINRDGAFVMRAEKVGAETALAQIVSFIAAAQRSRAPIQRLADQVSGWFAPLVIVIAAVTFAVWSLFGPSPRLGNALVSAVSVLIIACPCALGLATPMAIMVGIGRGAAAGLLFRNAETLERLSAVEVLALDKTGTLTEGRPSVIALAPAGGAVENELLRLAASVELSSEHPLAKAIVAEAQRRGISLAPVKNFNAFAGAGVAGDVDGRKLLVASEKTLRKGGLDPGNLAALAAAHRQAGATTVFLVVDGALAGVIAIADPIRPTARSALAALRKAGLRIVMLTGDSEITARAVAKSLDLGEVVAEATPEGKAAAVARIRAEGRVVAMAGDGVNYGPALAAADVGVAMGGGADVAIESAGVVLLNGDLSRLIAARRLSIATMRNIRENLFFAFIYNFIGVPIAAGVLYPWGIALSPIFAAMAMAFSSVCVIANALRLRRVDL
ncbi:MAG TPA: copper-translocating P-type ATPase, partial [Roseiarcus sp.]|nr:copper-translocating P-type ATPase [Roseiarcus sp.]